MATKYRIRTGEQFKQDGKTLVGGELIELDDDVAALHRNRIEPADQAPAAAAPTNTVSEGE